MAEIKRQIEEDGNGDYTTLEACMNDNEQDLDSGGNNLVVEICGTDLGGNGWDSADGTAVDIDGYTTSENCDILIYTMASARSSTGIFTGAPKYRLDLDGVETLQVDDNWVTIQGIQIEGTNARIGSGDVCTNILIDSCILKGDGVDSDIGIGLGSATDGSGWKVINTIIYNYAAYGIYANYSDNTTIEVYNCTISACDIGMKINRGTVIVKNCAIFNSTDDLNLAGATATIDCCASDDGDGTNVQDLNENAGGEWTAAFTDYANGDFSVKDTNSLLYNNGTDLADPEGVTDDIIGTARPQAVSWDIGAFELVAAGGISIPVIMQQMNQFNGGQPIL